ncbi:hypothetical protein [Kribbella sp. VKM Ac-2568]|uniref:hypothetical protein n=1 Tax=Kribbella sp. VKM Ac-2568 TaxID=2512219 RepID=UPI0010E3962C|nr:hypothetical protein [Kribbella sp. VKM Ac-2568]TCM34438.1 dioxygenase-like protein [Kribbella sp. VKM Ac-2568]
MNSRDRRPPTGTAGKVEVGELLRAYDDYKTEQGNRDGPELCVPGRRAWTLTYPDLGFQLDVLPAIPNENLPPTGIRLTDVNSHFWQHSNAQLYFPGDEHNEGDIASAVKLELMLDPKPEDDGPGVRIQYDFVLDSAKS